MPYPLWRVTRRLVKWLAVLALAGGCPDPIRGRFPDSPRQAFANPSDREILKQLAKSSSDQDLRTLRPRKNVGLGGQTLLSQLRSIMEERLGVTDAEDREKRGYHVYDNGCDTRGTLNVVPMRGLKGAKR